MEWEAPVDAWYVWLAVALVSLAIFGLALAMPTAPPPDANAGANVIDEVAASPYDGTASFDHDADEIRVDATGLSMANDHGTSHASVSYGAVIHVDGVDGLERVAHGEAYDEVYDERFSPSAYEFLEAVDEAHEAEGEWHRSSGTVTVRQVRLDSRLLDVLGRFSPELDSHRAVTDRWDGVHYDSTREEFYVVLVSS